MEFALGLGWRPVRWLGTGLVLLTALGSVAIAVSRRASRRLAPVVVMLGWLAAGAVWLTRPAEASGITTLAQILALALAIGLAIFWLVDRGIPANRSRPSWLSGVAVLLVVIAGASAVLTLRG